MAGQLTDAEQSGLFGDTSKPAPSVPTTAAPASSTAPLTTSQQQALFGDTSKPPPTPEGSGAPGWADAFQAGTYRGLADILNAPSAWFGGNPLIDTEGSLLTPGEKQAAQAHPLVAGAGRGFGQVVGTAPALVAASEAIPAIGGTALVPSLIRGGLTGAAMGAGQNLLTAGENPQESLLSRAERGAAIGGPLGLLGGALEPVFGAATIITPEAQAAGNRMVNAGLDVRAPNLAPAGAAATPDVVQQANKAWGNIFGQTTPDFSDTTLNTIMPKLGQDVGNAAKAGQVSQSAMLPRSGQTVADTFSDIAADYATTPQIQRLLRNVQAQFDPTTGVLDGGDFQQIVRHNSPLDLATRSRNADVAEGANRIEQALSDGFGQSSPPGVSDAYSLAREKYKLAVAAEANADAQGNLVPAKLYSTLARMYPDISRLGSGSTLTDQAVQFARDADRLYGGPAARMPGGLAGDLGSMSAGAILGSVLPSLMANPLAAAAIAAVPPVLRGVQRLGQRYQLGSTFGNALLQRGAQGAGPYLAGPLGAGGTALAPQGQVPRTQ